MSWPEIIGNFESHDSVEQFFLDGISMGHYSQVPVIGRSESSVAVCAGYRDFILHSRF